VLARHGRLGLLAEIVAAAERLADELDGQQQATFAAAYRRCRRAGAGIVAEVEKALAANLAHAHVVVDPAIVGRAPGSAGSERRYYDQSVASSLQRLGHSLKQRGIP